MWRHLGGFPVENEEREIELADGDSPKTKFTIMCQKFRIESAKCLHFLPDRLVQSIDGKTSDAYAVPPAVLSLSPPPADLQNRLLVLSRQH